MQRKKDPGALTILLVPHTRRAPVSLRIPVWLVSLISVILVASITAAAVFAVQYIGMRQRVNTLLAEQATERVRQREMRATILSQQDEVRNLSLQVEGFKSELLSVRRLSDEIRDILGLPTPTPAATPSASVAPAEALSADASGRSQSWGWRDASQPSSSEHMALRPSARSMRTAVERGHEVVSMRSSVPAEVQSLQELRDLVRERMSRLGKNDTGDSAALQRDLRQWAMAPHLWPVFPHPITSLFGYREMNGVGNYHYGLDMSAWIGTKVHATKDGTVTTAEWRSGFGLVVMIDHEGGYTTIYGHNSSLLVKVGDKVKAGDVIALSGNSGWSTGPHVHYEIHLNGIPVDPLRYIDGE